MFKNLKKNLILILLYFVFHQNYLLAEIVKKIEIFGNERISKETIKVFSSIDVGIDMNVLEIDNLLKRLYDTNFFKDISISFKNNILKIDVLENPIIENITYNGIKSNNIKEKIFSNLILKNKSSFNEIILNEDKKSISDSLKELGYFFSEVEVLIEYLDDNKINIVYDINLNQKAKIKKISFLGPKIFKDRQLKNTIISEEYKFWKFVSGRKYLNPNTTELDIKLLKNFYLNKGYYDVEINSSFAEVTNNNQFELIFNIKPGNKFYFGELKLDLPIDFQKSNFFKLYNILSELKEKPYSLFAVQKILDEIDQITIMDQYESIKSNVIEDINDNKINLTFKIEETEKFFIEKINIFGNNITRENVIRNQFVIDEGDPFNEILFNKSINNLKSLNFFKNVESQIKDGDNYNTKVLDISVVEKPTGEISAGAGFGTSGGTVAFAISENNYLGKGISLDTSLTINEESVKGNFYVLNPHYKNTDNSIYFNIEALETNRLSESGYKSNKTGLSLGTTFEYLSNLNLSLGISNFYERIETDSTASVLQQKQKGNYLDSFININADYDKRNQKFKTSDGFRSIYSVDLPLISDSNTFNNSYDFRYYTQLFEENITSLSISLKTSNSLSDNVKLSERIFVPGNKLRGFERGKVGPKDGNDFIGGNYMSTVNISTTIPKILENLQNVDIIAFSDIANLWGVDYDSSIDKNNDIKSSIGIGIDWFSIIGPLNFTLAYPITKNSTDVTETFRFNIGTSF